MPTYVYTCDTCQTQFEKFQSFKEDPLRTCPHCQNDTARRVFQPVGIVFKGSGWYINDSRNSDKSTLGGKSDNKSETNSETKSETNSESSSTSETKSDSTSDTTSNTTSTSGASESS